MGATSSSSGNFKLRLDDLHVLLRSISIGSIRITAPSPPVRISAKPPADAQNLTRVQKRGVNLDQAPKARPQYRCAPSASRAHTA